MSDVEVSGIIKALQDGAPSLLATRYFMGE